MPPRPRQHLQSQESRQERQRRPGPSIAEVLKSGQRSFSLEFMPPRTEQAREQFWHAIRQLEPLKPTFVSVTYGAGGSTRDRTVSITGAIAEHTMLDPVAHLTVVNHSVQELRQVIGCYADVGVRNVLALRGDPPGDPNATWVKHPDGLSHASQLVELVKASGDFCVGVAAFPELHPRSPDEESDTRHFVAKCRAGADFAITQMFFYAEDYLRFRDRAAARGCDIPIIPGIMPPTSVRILERAMQLGGCKIPVQLLDQLRTVSENTVLENTVPENTVPENTVPENTGTQGYDQAAVRKIGVEFAARLSQTLLAEGAPGLHFYTLNAARATLELYGLLGLAPVSSGSTAPITA